MEGGAAFDAPINIGDLSISEHAQVIGTLEEPRKNVTDKQSQDIKRELVRKKLQKKAVGFAKPVEDDSIFKIDDEPFNDATADVPNEIESETLQVSQAAVAGEEATTIDKVPEQGEVEQGEVEREGNKSPEPPAPEVKAVRVPFDFPLLHF